MVNSLNSSFSAKGYCKPYYTNQYLHFSSYHPMAYKWPVASTLLKRATSHCSTADLVCGEVSRVKEALGQSG